jgi:choline kinase
MRKEGITDICIVSGYLSEQVAEIGHRIICNYDYSITNMVASLMCASEILDGTDDVIISYGDIVYESRVLKTVIGCEHQFCTVVDDSWLRLWQARSSDPLSDAESLKLDSSLNIVEIGRKPGSMIDIQGQYIGLTKVSGAFARTLVNIYNEMDRDFLYDGRSHRNMFMTSFLQYAVDLGHHLHAVVVSGGWLEVDTVSDLELYNRMHMDGILSNYYKYSI